MATATVRVKDFETIGTYKLTASEYIAKHDPTRIGINEIGTWYEHPVYGDEAGLLLVITGDHQIHQTYFMDVPEVSPDGELY